MSWKRHLPLITATALILATQVICTYALIGEQRQNSVDRIHETMSACTDKWTFEKVGRTLR